MKKKKKILLIILVLLVILTILVFLGLLVSRTANTESQRLYLPEGTSQEALVDTLQTHGILSSGLETKIFNLQFSILKSRIHPGSYVVAPHMGQLALVRKLRNGQQDPIRLTIGKFRTPDQLNAYLDSKLMHNNFNVPIDSFYLIRPNTYEFYWTITPEQFLHRMRKEFKTALPDSTASIFNFQFSIQEIIILASIVEEETNNNAEKPLIASVYLNRLIKGMPLQADPTVKYAVGDFTLRRILNKHLAVDNPFNTYRHAGLPPAPICLPSDASVNAVLKAPKTNHLYFCASDRMDGTHRFAATLTEHNRNAVAFHIALNKRGIQR